MKPKPRKRDLLAGNWRLRDEWSDVEYRISGRAPHYKVKVWDFFDDEAADIFKIKWHASRRTLSFSAHWNSTGRTLNCQMHAMSETQADLTYSYTEMAALARHPGKKA